MARRIIITGIHLHANATPCAHHCRYCQLRTSRAVAAPFGRYAALVDRFLDWRERAGVDGFEVCPWYGNSHEHDPATLAGIRRLERRQGDGPGVVLLGGVRQRTGDELRRWLEERRAAGIETVVATFSGHGADHDHWNNLAGNYAFQLAALRMAGALGMAVQQRLLLIRDTVAGAERLFDDLDAIAAGPVDRWAIPLFYSGTARRLEEQRLTEDDFAALPERLRAALRGDHRHWRSEADWRRRVLDGDDDDDRPQPVPISFPVTEESLTWAEARPVEAIVAWLSARWRRAYTALPSRRELAERHGDPANGGVYLNVDQVERLWMDRHRRRGDRPLDLRFTQFH